MGLLGPAPAAVCGIDAMILPFGPRGGLSPGVEMA